MAKYLRSVEPFLNEKEIACTKEVVKKFLDPNGIAHILQMFIEEKAKSSSNWLSEWWLQTAYLGFRESVVVYSSPGQALPFQKFKDDDERLCYAAQCIQAAAAYILLIRR